MCTHHIEAIQVVHVAVLPGSMHCIFDHGDLWPIEDRRLIHVIPDIKIILGTLEGLE